MKRDLEYQQTFAENIQVENRKLLADVENLTRLFDLKEKDLNLARKECAGLKEDNERINRMYLIMQKEAFHGVDKLKKMNGGPVSAEPIAQQVAKRGYQPLRADNGAPGALGANPIPKKTQNMWQIVDDGFDSNRDFSNITGIVSDGGH